MELLLCAGLVAAVLVILVRGHYWRDYLKRRAQRDEQLLFFTHTPDAYRPGLVHEKCVITRAERTNPTALINGGAQPCWKVFGRKQAGL